MTDPDRLWKIWFQPGSFIEYYPIEQTLQWAQWELFRDNTLGYHATNLVLHLISALLVWRLLAKFQLRLAWLGGLLFMVHPVMVESVAWMSEFKNTLSLPPFLLAACAYIDYDNRGRPRDYLLSLGLFLVAMLGKISMAPFPFVILLYAWWKRGSIGWRDVRASAPFFVISLVLGLTTILAGIWFRPTHHMGPDQVEFGGTWARIDLMGRLAGWYFWHTIFPVSLSFFYPRWIVDPSTIWQFFPWPIFAGVAWYLWTKRHGWGRHALLGLGFFFLNLAPFLGLTIPSYMGFTWAMDHFLYLPFIGLAGLAVAGMELAYREISGRARPWGIALVAAVMVCLSMISHRYAGTFRDAESLWGNTVEIAPNSEIAYGDLGSALMHKGRYDEAIVQFGQAIALNPIDPDVRNELAQALAQSGKLAESMKQFDMAIQLNPRVANSYANRGHLWQIQGNTDKAIADLTSAIEINPDLPQPYINRGAARQLKGDWQGELADLQQYCRLAPLDQNADYARCWAWFILAQHGQKIEADRELSDAFQNHWNSPHDEWPSPIARFLLGQSKEEIFLAAASSENPEQARYQQCEAWYFAGMMRLLLANKAGAVEAFQKSIATGETQELSYTLAKGQLGLLGAH